MNVFRIMVFFCVQILFCIVLYLYLQGKGKETLGYRGTLALSCILVLLNDAIIVFIMAFLGQFTLGRLCIVVFVESLLMGIAVYRQKNTSFSLVAKGLVSGWNKPFAVIFLAAIILYICFPTTYIWARRDPALYTTDAIHIAETGQLEYAPNTFISDNYEEIKGFTELTYRGFYSDYIEGRSDDPGKVTFQFLHMYPALLAIGYSLKGLECLCLVTPCIAVFSLLSIYYFASVFFSKRVATITALFTVLNPAQLWSARITQTEMLFQVVCIVGIGFLMYGLNYNRRKLCFYGAALLGFLGFIRIDAYLIGFALIACCIIMLLLEPLKMNNVIIVSLIYLAVSVVSLFITVRYSPYYFIDHWKAGYLDKMFYGMGAIVILEILVFFIALFTKGIGTNRHGFQSIAENKSLCGLIVLSLALMIYLAYFVRPLFQTHQNVDSDFDKRAMVEFCWYCSVMMLPLFLYQLWKTLRNYQRLLLLFPFLAVGIGCTVVYIYKPGVAPDHIWASRRWVSICYTFITVFAAAGIDGVSTKIGSKILEGNGSESKSPRKVCSSISAIMVSCIAVYMLFQCRLFIFQPMLHEMKM